MSAGLGSFPVRANCKLLEEESRDLSMPLYSGLNTWFDFIVESTTVMG